MEWIKQDEEVLSYWHRRNLEDPPRGTLWPDHLKGEEADEYWLETISDYDWDQLQKGKEGAIVAEVTSCTFGISSNIFEDLRRYFDYLWNWKE